MRRPRFQVTLGSLMIVVAISGAAIGFVERHQRFRRLNSSHAAAEALARQSAVAAMRPVAYAMVAAPNGGRYCVTTFASGSEARRDRWIGVADFHARMAKKYERAARNPWLLCSTDPPEPQHP